jgi:predicted nucleic acid-binding protein
MNKKYILDSDILIYFLKGDKDVIEKVLSLPKDDLYITIVNYTELLYGIYNSNKVTQNKEKILPFLEKFKLLQFDKSSSKIFAKLKAKLKKQGNIIADMDLMIASIAISNKAILFTNNLKHFKRIESLKILSFEKI